MAYCMCIMYDPQFRTVVVDIHFRCPTKCLVRRDIGHTQSAFNWIGHECAAWIRVVCATGMKEEAERSDTAPQKCFIGTMFRDCSSSVL